MGSPVSGHVSEGFEPVAEAFERNFDNAETELGAALCLYVGGEKVVDLVGGIADEETGRPYDHDTLQMVYSTTKGLVAICAHMLVQRGELDLDAPMAQYWPEFAAAGKQDITVRQVLSHQSGVLDVDGELTPAETRDWATITARLAAAAPCWEPGTRHGYHAISFGYLVGELIRRISGRTVGTFMREEVVEPLGLEAWIGLPPEQHHRVAPLRPPAIAPQVLMMMGIDVPEDAPTPYRPEGNLLGKMMQAFMPADSLAPRAFHIGESLMPEGGDMSSADIWSIESPSVNGVTTAASLARFYGATVSPIDGIRLLDQATVEAAATTQAEGPDAILGFPSAFSLGFMKNCITMPLGTPEAFGHYGYGGSIGLADPKRGLALGYTPNSTVLGIAGDQRSAQLIQAAFGCLD